MYEARKHPLITRKAFLARLSTHALLALSFAGASLLAGILGYRELESLSWTDAFLNAAMILGGMGPVNELHTEAGKLFAGIYALYSGVVFLVTTAIMLGPLAHRMLHRFHVDAPE
jgi:hypothetical protein